MINQEDEKPLSKTCPNCFSEIGEGVDFCAQCGRPVGDFVNYDPVKRIWAQGWAYRQAVARPNSSIIFYGMLLLFGLPLIVMVRFIFVTPGWSVVIPLICSLIYGGILFRMLNHYRRKETSDGS